MLRREIHDAEGRNIVTREGGMKVKGGARGARLEGKYSKK